MPNGRSGGFVIETVDLRELVKAVSDTTVVGQAFVNSLPPRLVSSSEVSRLVEECPLDRVAVEEQDSTAYVIHLSNEPELKWLFVGSQSPIFPALRQRHSQWMTEHPDWHGWIAF